MTRLGLLRMILILGYVVWLVMRAARPKMGFATWHMFTSVYQAELYLVDTAAGEATFSPWIYLPHTALCMSPTELLIFLRFAYDQGHRLSGRVILREGLSERTLRIEDGDVVA